MKTFFNFGVVLITALLFGSTEVIAADLAFEGHPDLHHVANGRYQRVYLSGGTIEYRASRSDANFNAEVIRYNVSTGRWELYVTRTSGGTQELIARTAPVSSVNIFTNTWAMYNYVGTGPVWVIPPTKVYETIDQRTTCNGCLWNSTLTWASRIIPRTYDNVVIDGNVLIDGSARCNNLAILTGTSSSPVRSLVGRAEGDRIRIMGDLRHGLGTLLDITEVEFAGNDIQTLQSAGSPTISVYAFRVRINNPKNVRLNSRISIFGRGSVRSDLIFMSGKIYLGNYDLRCEQITDANENRFVVTDGRGSLYLHARRAGESMLQRFPVGPSAGRYSPILVLFATTNRDFSAMSARTSYDPSIFELPDHVNILYTIDHGTAVTSTGTTPSWVYQFQWDAADATPEFSFPFALQVQKRSGTSWSGAVGSGMATGSGPYKLLFTARSTGLNNFGISFEHKRLAGARIGSTESDMVAGENAVLDFRTFPNPATPTGFNVTVNNPESAKLRLQNLAGTQVAFKSQHTDEHTLAISPSQVLSPGIYLLQVNENDQTRLHKVLIK